MKIGLLWLGIGDVTGPDSIRELAVNAERLGYGTLWAPEHVVIFDNYTSRYPYSKSGAFPLNPAAEFCNPLIALAFAAACTSRIRLATGICLVPEHNPLILAKEVATLDQLARGRFALGVGLGWSAEEFTALGLPFEGRARRTREYIEVMRRLWSEERTSYKGEFVQIENARSYPKPVSRGKLPIIFGGEGLPALKRVASYGDGWCGFNLDPDEARAKIEQLNGLLREKGRDPRECELIVSPYNRPCNRDGLKKYRDAGVREVVLMPAVMGKPKMTITQLLEEIAREWVEPAMALD